MAPFDPAPYLRLVIDRFGMPADVFDRYTIRRASKKYLTITAADHVPPTAPEAASVGIPFMRTLLKYPKLTGAAAQLLGGFATRNVVDVDAGRAAAFFRREAFDVSADEARRCTDEGYVLVRLVRHTLGVGYYRPAGEAGSGGAVGSLFPKHKTLG